jgi:hypothetical protein
LMLLSNRCWGVKHIISLRRAAECMIVFPVDISRRIMELRGMTFNVDGALTASTEWLGSRLGGDALGVL